VEKQFIDLISTHQRLVQKVCRLYCPDPAERADLLQEIMLQLWRAFPRFRGEARATTWLYRVALNTAITGFRREQRAPLRTDLAEAAWQNLPQPDPDPLEDQLAQLYAAIGQLSGVEKAIVLLHLEDKDSAEIAEIVGITPNYVRVKMTRIRERLRTLLIPQPV
jgi:RNA polymerase sigma-70 factor, ECF subfamily